MRLDLDIPTEVISGDGVVVENYKKFLELGKKTLIVVGKKSSKINGSLSDVLEALDKCNIDYYIFDKVDENPSIEIIESGYKLGRSVGVDFIIAIGGGSAIDSAKAISIMIKNRGLKSDILFKNIKLDYLKIVAIPTTAGSGSEVTQYSILTDNNKGKKRIVSHEIYPTIAMIDYNYTKGTNISITRNTAMDSFSHMVEGYLNINATRETDMVMHKALALWGECLDGLLRGETTDDERKKLSEASVMAGSIISKTGISLPHKMGYPLTYNKGLAHGVASTCLYSEYLESIKNKNKVNNIISILGFSTLKDLQKVINRLTVLNIDITEEEINKYTKDIMNDSENFKNNIQEIDYEGVYKIYYNSLISRR